MFDKLIENFPKLVAALRKMRVWDYIGLIVLAFLFVVLYITWDARQTLIQRFVVSNIDTSTPLITLSTTTKRAGYDLVNRYKFVVALQVVNVEWQTNSRSTAFFYSDLAEMQKIVDEGMKRKETPTPLLTKDPDNNERFRRILSGQFSCTPIDKIIMTTVIPGIEKFAKSVCSTSIPPYPGKFSGYINLYVDRIPSDEELTDIETVARTFSSDVFVKDVGH